MSKEITCLSLKDFKPVLPLLLLNIAGYIFIFWFIQRGDPYADIKAEPDYYALCVIIGWLSIWVLISFLLRRGTTLLQFISLWLISTFVGLILTFFISTALPGDNILSYILGIPATLNSITTGVTLLLRKYKKVGSSPAFLFALATWSWLLSMTFFLSGMLFIDLS